MTQSQNVLFVGASRGNDEFGPPGLGIARMLEAGLREEGLAPSSPEDWRNCGWSLSILVRDVPVEVALASTSEAELWMLQVAGPEPPGLLGRLFGKSSPDRSREVFEVARTIHTLLARDGFTEIRWCLDGYPDESESTSMR